ncbi:MAG: hypothetical protein JWO93_2336 [Micrococcaceae bacterium]|nr:hypothetical protein [Micrococcaceae bacterium]
MSYQRHDSYFSVDSVWLREVPASWKYSPLWPHFHVVEDRAGSLANALELLSVSQSLGVLPRSAISDKEPRADDLSNYRHCRAGDVVVNRMSAYQGAVGVSPQEGIVSPDYLVLRCAEGLRPDFLVHLLKTAGVIGEIVLRLRGIGSPGAGTVRTPRIGASELGRISIPLPSVQEQDMILLALDRETAQVGDLISKQKRLIKVLAEKRQALITHAVTKGLDPSAPTKTTGNPWLSEVPAHWTEKPMCHFMTGRVDYRGATPKKTDQGIFLVTARNVRKGFIDYAASSEYIAPEDYDSVMSRGIPAVGDILMTMEAPLGNVALVDDPHVALAQRVVKFRPKNELVPEFAAYAMNSPYFQSQLESRATGSTALGLKASKLIELRLAAPSRMEQQQIVEHLNGAILRIDSLLQRAESAIKLLQERRSALISAAVTGKIDVQEGVA